MNIRIGADPEYFVKQNGVFVSAHGLVNGNKKNPLKVDKGAVQVDGMALEFNIDPAESEDEFFVNINTVFAQLKAMCPDHEHVIAPVADFPLEYINSQPLEARELGCDPDFNAWSGLENVKPDAELPMRTASGHIHIGWAENMDKGDPNLYQDCRIVAKQMDFFLGLPSLFFDADERRRQMYGKAGCFRPKPYGMEYRTLSNAWLTSENLIKWAFRNARKGMEQVMQGNILEDQFGSVDEIINTSNKKEAAKIIKAAGLEMA